MASSLIVGVSQMNTRPQFDNKFRKPFVDESAEECSRRLFVRNVPRCFDEVDIYRLFEPYGIISDIRFPQPTSETQCARFAFVTYMKKSMSECARIALDQKVSIKHDTVDLILDSPLRVEVYIPRHGLPQRRSPFKEYNQESRGISAHPLRPLFDFENEAMLYSDLGQDTRHLNYVNLPSRPLPRKHSPSKRRFVVKPIDGITYSKLSDEKYQGVVLTHYVNPYDFYLRLLSFHSAYKDLLFRLAREYENKGPTLDEILSGTLIAVKYERKTECNDDEKTEWCRAFVTAVNKLPGNKTYYYCTLVDTGEKVTFTEQDTMHRLANHFINLPFQAMRCALGNVRPLETDWSDEAVKNSLEFLSNTEHVVSAKALHFDFNAETQYNCKFGADNASNRPLVNQRALVLIKIDNLFNTEAYLHQILVDQAIAKPYENELPADIDVNYRLYRAGSSTTWLPSTVFLEIKKKVDNSKMSPAKEVLDRIRNIAIKSDE